MTLEQRLAIAEDEIETLKKQLVELSQSTSCLLNAQIAEIQSLKVSLNTKTSGTNHNF